MALVFSFHLIDAQAIDGTKIKMHFPFDSDVSDDSSEGVTLNAKTANVVDTYVTGRIGDAALFNGKPYITTGSTFDAGASFTIALWIKFNSVNVPSGTGTPKIIHQEEDPDANTLAGRPFQLSGATRPINTSFGEAVAFNSTTSPSIDEWVHIALVMDKTAETIKMYINGIEDRSESVGNAIKVDNKTNNAELSFGVQKSSSTVGLLDGYMDDFLITTEVLTQNQIKSVMTLGVAESKTSNTNIWLGTSADFGTGANWSQGTSPVVAENVIIQSGVANNPTASATFSAKNIIIQKNASLDAGTNAITATSTTVYGGGSLIAKSTVSGTFIYNAITTINNTAPPQISGSFNPAVWNLMSSPVVGETYDNAWILDNFIGTGTGPNRAIALYDNTLASSNWDYYQANTTAATFDSGIGFSTRKKTVDYQSNNEEFYEFIGTFPDADVSLTITQGAGSNWNLVGNPYPSYISAADLVTNNTTNLSAGFKALYIWDPSDASYKSLPGTHIAPGQGFFVNAANSTANNFVIAESLQSHQTGVNATFYKNNATKISLKVTNGNLIRATQINYANDHKLGLDDDNDIGMFTGVGSSLNIYSELLENNTGIAFERQALPDSGFESMVIPIGVIADAGQEITFSSNAQNLPSGVAVYLEDREKNSYTRLNESDTYTITPTSALKGTGRFYMHTSASSVLSTEDTLLSSINIYNTNNTNLRITGLKSGKASVELFNILGKRVVSTTFSAVGVKNISLPILATGVYIVKLQTATGNTSKKIILE